MKILVGVFALCLLFSFNLRHALNDYGVSNPNNELHPQVLAQTNSAGDGGNSGGGSSGGDGDCNFINGYTRFSTEIGGAYDCCRVWRNRDPHPEARICE